MSDSIGNLFAVLIENYAAPHTFTVSVATLHDVIRITGDIVNKGRPAASVMVAGVFATEEEARACASALQERRNKATAAWLQNSPGAL
ncbi:hypothetical protein [Chitinasiproducens palmae]|uniref:hypothetical protein n=1 Tax=Chitinasiproducens palmae TaxID=1770053 RepID=UPI000B8331B2|nr:hypothetical protein [Chitinasiproducens palmae]